MALLLTTLKAPDTTPAIKLDSIFTPHGLELSVPKTPDFNTEVLIPLRNAQAQELEAANELKARQDADAMAYVAPPAKGVVYTPRPIQSSYSAPPPAGFSTSGLIGSIGWATAGGNCVNEPGVNNPHDGTNPISWAVLSGRPWIGATVLFPYNHTGVVTGLWGNGDVEIRHQNCSGCPHRYSLGSFRGFR